MTVARRALGPTSITSLAGWVVAALINTLSIALAAAPRDDFLGRVVHAGLDLGQTLALGVVSAAVVGAWLRWGSLRPRVTYGAAYLAALTLAELVLADDLQGAADRFGGPLGATVTLHVAVALLALVPVACFAAGRALSRLGRWSFAGLAVSVLLFVGNFFVLENGYHGAHAYLAGAAATLFSASLLSPRVERFLEARVRPLPALVVLGVIVLGAGTSVLVNPPSRVRIALLQRDTAFLAPWLSTFHQTSGRRKVDIPPGLKPWYRSRAKRRDVAPSTPPLLPQGPIVIVITIDALRQEVFGPDGPRIAPSLHEMRQNAVYFTQARSFGSDTRFSLAALFTGRHLSMLTWNFESRSRPTLELDTLPRLPELLNPHGVATVTAVTLPDMMVPRIGIVRGFSEEFRKQEDAGKGGTRQAIDNAIERLKNHGSGPLFFYAHLIDPHQPYQKHDKRAKSPHEAYLGEVTFTDEHVGRLRRAVREFGLAERTVFIVSSDHGEAFGEHGLKYHNKPLYDVMVHVPLMVECPGIRPATVDAHVSLMDVGATVLDLFGVPRPGYWMSESLVPHLRGEKTDPERPIYMERMSEQAVLFGDGVKVMLRQKPRSEEIYDLRTDPAEETDLRETLRVEADRRVALARAYTKAHATKSLSVGSDD